MILEKSTQKSVLLLLLMILAGCGNQSGQSKSESAVGSEKTTSPGISPEIRDNCNVLAQFAAQIPGATVSRSEGHFQDELTSSSKLGCLIEIQGSFKALGKQDAPDTQLSLFAERKGWQQDITHSADGPDGTVFAFQTPAAWCLVTGSWDGGDDSDPVYVPDDHYKITVGCTSQP